MSLTKLNTNLNNIQALSDRPNEGDGALTPSELKETFDKAGNDIKTYINSTLTTEVDNSITTVNSSISTLNTNISNQIGTLSNLTTTAKTNLVAAINEVNAKPDDSGWQNLTAAYGTWEYLRYRKIGNKVRVEGRCPSYKFTGSTTKVIGLLPSGYRPQKSYYLMAAGAGRRIVRYVFGNDGRITIDYAVLFSDGSYLSDTDWTEFSYEFYVD